MHQIRFKGKLTALPQTPLAVFEEATSKGGEGGEGPTVMQCLGSMPTLTL